MQALPFAAALAAAWLAAPAQADGMKDPVKVRAICEKNGQADTPANLKRCCSNYILVESMKEQLKLEAQCVAGSGSGKSKSEKPAQKES